MEAALARLALADPWVAPTVSVKGLTTVGPLDRDQAWQGLVAVEREIVRCFHGSEPPVPSSVLTVRLGWTVSAEGLADSMTVLDTAAAPGLDACLVDALTEARFPNAPTPTTMETRLALAPTSPEASRLHRGPAVVLSGGTGPIPPNAGVLGALSDPPMTGLGGLLGSSGRSVLATTFGTSKVNVHTEVEQASGDLVVGDVEAALTRQQPALTACYLDGSAVRPDLAGAVVADLTFGRADATKAKVSPDTTVDPAIAACVADVLTTLTAPARGKARVVIVAEARSGPPAGVGGDPILLGAISKSAVDEVIQGAMNRLAHCYERELPEAPALAGKITVKFVIAKEGTVSSATTKATTMNHPAVESCVNQVFLDLRFPPPAGGGIVIASYPLLFQPG